jgi:integrase
MASIQPYASGYRAQVNIKGVRDSRVFRTKREAAAWAASREAELREAKATPIGKQKTLRDAMLRYGEEISPHKRGSRWEEIRIDALLRNPAFPADTPLADVTPEAMGVWRDARLRVVSAGSVLREIGLVSAVFQAARLEWRWVETNPLRSIRKPRSPDHRYVVITRQQIRALLTAMQYSPAGPVRTVSQAVAVCFLVALRTGMRAGELCNLTWEHVHPGYCVLPTTKTVPRDVPLTSKATRLIERMRGYDPVTVFGMRSQSLDANFRKYRERAGLEGFTFHDSRHTAATWLAPRLPVLDLCRMFGWSNTSQALTYYNPSAAEIAKRLD